MNDLELLHALNHTSHLFRRKYHEELEQNDKLKGTEVFGYGRMLHLLIKNGDMTQKEIAEIMDIRPQSLTNALERLEEKEYITRVRDDNDRRIQHVHLTKEGKKIGEALHKSRKKAAHAYFDCLKDSEKETLLEMLNRILENSENAYD